MNIIDLKVSHKSFGEGTIVSLEDNIAVVNFLDVGNKKFQYPKAFEQFLTFVDASVQEAVTDEIAIVKANEINAAETARKKIETTVAIVEKKTSGIDNGFGPDYHVEHLARQPILTYEQVENGFGIKITGFGKGINKTDSTLVLISSVDKKKTGFVYHDMWDINGDYIYSGEGKNDDQKMSGGNIAIKNAAADGKTIHLFVKLSPKEYYYQGIFTLVDYSYEDEKDENGNVRKEYKFRLRKTNLI